MKIELRRWTMSDSKELTALCNAVDRSFLSDRLPYPYTEEDAKAWLNMVAQNDSVTGIYRAIVMDVVLANSSECHSPRNSRFFA